MALRVFLIAFISISISIAFVPRLQFGSGKPYTLYALVYLWSEA